MKAVLFLIALFPAIVSAQDPLDIIHHYFDTVSGGDIRNGTTSSPCGPTRDVRIFSKVFGYQKFGDYLIATRETKRTSGGEYFGAYEERSSSTRRSIQQFFQNR